MRRFEVLRNGQKGRTIEGSHHRIVRDDPLLRFLRRLGVTGMLLLLVLVGLQATADASDVARVSGVAVRSQNWCGSSLRVGWRAVPGATYQVRWASAKARLRTATPVATRRHATSIGPLAGGTTFFQVRAVRHGRAGAWSGVRSGRFTSHWPAEPRMTGNGVPGGVQFTWGCTQYASRYRVAWAAAPFGSWPTTPNYVSGWLPQYARSSTFAVPATPQPGDHMLGVAYANPVYGRLEAGNPSGGVRRATNWVPVFPTPPDPGTGDAVRLGTYNVLGAPTGGPRVQAIAANISSHGLGIVALQEATTTTAQALVSTLGGGWAYVPYTGTTEQIIYRSSWYGVAAKGTFSMPHPASSTPITVPWARLTATGGSSRSQPVYVVSAHILENPSASTMTMKHDAGVDAQALMAGIGAVNVTGAPVVIAGDLQYLREPYGDVANYVEAPPTLVRGGYYDAMAAVSKININYPTYNSGNGTTAPPQAPAKSGVSPRCDYIMLKGFRSSNAYVNVANWSLNGLTPSDHNLVYADLTVPFSG
jgi:hypothetical protein